MESASDMRNPAGCNDGAIRKAINGELLSIEPALQDQQARRLVRLYPISYAVALTVSMLAFGGCRQ